MTRLLLAVLFGTFFAGAASGADFSEQPAELGGLHGTLTWPAGTATVPAALILAGSGPTDRDGNAPGMMNDSLKMLARALAAHGIASLRVDKRGIGQSLAGRTDEASLRFSTYVDDARRWARFLHAFPRIRSVFLIGHSEGALVATMAAQVEAPDGIILIAGAGRPASELLLRQLRAAGATDTVLSEVKTALDRLRDGKTVAVTSPALQPVFRASVQPYLMSWLPLDPVAELRRVSAPVLVVQGTSDLQVSPDDARRLAAARPGIETLTIADMNHVLKKVPMDRADNIATYSDPNLPLAEGLVSGVAGFVARHTSVTDRPAKN